MENELSVVLQEQEKEKVVLNGKEFLIGKIGIGKTWKLLTKISQLFTVKPNLFDDLKKSKENTFAEVMGFIALLPENTLTELVSIITDESIEFCSEIGNEELPEIVLAILKHNNIDKILKNWQRVAEEYKKPRIN
ncbi:hypothetical protein C0389_06820 [bacterium]|nr:hypothetical protein [bacterium]